MTPEEAALARSDRYLHEFVEALELCPYARPCRESGRLERRVVTSATLDLGTVERIIAELTSPSLADVEVALLLFPMISAGFLEFQRFVADARSIRQGADGFYLVAFHPDAPEDATNPQRLVSFLRRSPDPTIQLVRISVLERVRGVKSGETIWMDPRQITVDALPPSRPPSVSERIAQRDFETVERVGIERLRALLTSMRT